MDGETMKGDAGDRLPDQDVPQAREPLFQHVVATYASEMNKTASMWRAIPDDPLDFKPHDDRIGVFLYVCFDPGIRGADGCRLFDGSERDT
jgi:hypothetical protein